MSYIPVYDKPYMGTVLINDKTHLYVMDRLCWGPIFPMFIKADFATFDGFLEFTSRVGIDGLIFLDDESWRKTISDDLKRKKINSLTEVSNENRIPVSYIKKFYERIQGRLLEEQNYMSSFSSFSLDGIPLQLALIERLMNALEGHLSSVRLGVNFGHSSDNEGNERYRLIYSQKNEYSIRDYYFDFMSKSKKNKSPQIIKPYWFFHFGTLPARCYMEMIDIMQDNKEIRYCAYCKEIFIPHRKNEEFCRRFAPEQHSRGPRTCKQVGPQSRFQKMVDKNMLSKKKRFQNRLNYLKKTGRMDEYRRVMKAFEKWKRSN